MKSQHGLTLIEMMITVAIAAILITVGTPGINNMLNQNKVIADINNLSTVARVARFSAVDEALPVIVCPTADYTNCSTNWQQTKMVFADANADGKRNIAEPIIASADALTAGNTLTGLSAALTFFADGSVSQQATATICPSTGEAKQASALLISLYGRVAVATDSNNDDIKEDADGAALSCS